MVGRPAGGGISDGRRKSSTPSIPGALRLPDGSLPDGKLTHVLALGPYPDQRVVEVSSAPHGELLGRERSFEEDRDLGVGDQAERVGEVPWQGPVAADEAQPLRDHLPRVEEQGTLGWAEQDPPA